MSNQRKLIMRGFLFEDFLKKLFDYYNIHNIKNIDDLKFTDYFDFILENKYLVEVKISSKERYPLSSLKMAISKMKSNKSQYINTTGGNPTLLLIVGNSIDFDKISKEVESEDIKILDLSNILYLVRNNNVLREELVSILDFSTHDILPKKTEIELFDRVPKNIIGSNNVRDYKNKLSSWVTTDTTFSDYENLCIGVLKTLFNDDLTLWKLQQKSNEDLFRFDLICKIKSGEPDGFWKIVSDYFKTKYVIFEFKNYSKKITQKEIYTTEKYLYAKALRSVAIIISPFGEDENSKKAIKGTLRENGKLILSLTNSDLVKMLEVIENNGDTLPSDYLNEMLDDLLINLEK
ncbi:hypothetical protein [Lysinibacillus odysseyi]|uniref:Restriction endonuclease type IV Mrr domain-containing protein n=1 Tax=Lysinibacillus odysseyi 34hs-1 = NBRC 100172 TaxID=1220589 RepID=A0A0A3IH20_9BACI|nr:hypothetical protein [Lysinibacillus odysseyi]KGR82755.1 hypothetical protein CD32_18075 [Lysinibacillus odysseyi 34hs-1 = NBRC 100172]